MTKETIKNRNRIVNVLDNCAKVLSTKKTIDENSQKVLFRVKHLANLLRNTTECENTIERLNKVYLDIFNIPGMIKNPLTDDSKYLLRLQDIVEMGIKSYNDEKLDTAVSAYSTESLQERIKEKENELVNLNQSMSVMVADGAEGSKEYASQKRRSEILNTHIAKLKVMAEARKERDDREKVLSEKTASLVTGLDDAIKDLMDEKKRLENLFKYYRKGIIAIFIFLLLWESFLILNLYPKFSLNNFVNYIPLYLPIPLAAGLLWVCIYQMNKIQRLLVNISSMLQRFKYKDSLLKASVNLYADMRKNEEHVALLIDDMMKQKVNDENIIDKGDESSLLSLPFNKIIELVKAFGQK